jgi:amino acid adenylation domain-containing protein
LAIEIEEGETFVSLYKKVQIEVNQFLRQAQPGTSSAELSRSFLGVLNYIHAGFETIEELPMQSTWVHSGHIDAQHQIRMQVYDFDQSGEIEVHLDLNRAVFDELLEERAPQHFLNLVDALIDEVEQPIEAIKLTTEEEEKELIDTFNLTENKTQPYHNLVQAFEAQVAKTSQQVALQFNGELIDYQKLNERSNQVAHYLQAQKVGTGSRVALHFKRTPELLYTIWGVLKAGATYIPVPSNTPKQRVLDLIEEAEVDLLLTSTALKTRLASENSRIVALENQHKDHPTTNLNLNLEADDLAYIMFTSGSTGRPKGVMISHGALANYINWADQHYQIVGTRRFPLFTMIGFDLTVTSLFLPLVSGGELHIYEEADSGPDLSLVDVIKDNAVNSIKLTPSHLTLLADKELNDSQLQLMIVGGEDFKTSLARSMQEQIGKQLRIYNEYGPTEATVGCIVHQYDESDELTSVPIGQPMANMQAYVLDQYLNPVPRGVVGDLYLSGKGLAKGYWKRDELTKVKFVDHPFKKGEKAYQSGDLARWNERGQLEFLGRADEQIKIGGIRVEPGEIELALQSHPSIDQVVVDLKKQEQKVQQTNLQYCSKCGLPSNYPNSTFDNEGVCNFCHSFDTFEQKVQAYFKDKNQLRRIFEEAQSRKTGEYDCMMLLSGGKDSTYALGQLVEMGYKVLAFTLDNGYISQGALDNVRRVTKELGVDCIFGSTPAMNEIFVDSLKQFCNVCQGCFKTIYTLSMKIALEKGIPMIVTGLSRGQFFETRLTEELFWSDRVDIDKIDNIILNARKEYHRVDDAVKRLLDTSVFEDEETFEKVQFVDFYRFTDVSLEEMYEYLDDRLPWIRPSDTGRSTNCLINKLGIFVHTKEQGYSNYAFPYSYDVRMGHKKRATAIDEINEPIDEAEVRQMMAEIGYEDTAETGSREELVAFYVSAHVIADSELRKHLSKQLPDYMIPTRFVHIQELPLTANGKVDRKLLFAQLDEEGKVATEFVAPSTEFEELVAGIWQEVLEEEQIGVNDDFIALGGNSLEAIRINARITKVLELELPLNLIFEKPTVAAYSAYLEEMIEELLGEMEEA